HLVARGTCEFPPSYYLNRLFVDSAVFEERTLAFLVQTMGVDRVLLGSDYPFPLGEERIGSLIRGSALTRQVKNALLGANARSFLGLPAEPEKDSDNVYSVAAVASSGSAAPEPVQLTYSSYLKVPELLELQHPQSSPPHHDELLFIIVHQTYELWFKELLHDIDEVVANLRAAGANPESRDGVYEAARLLRRCTEITRVLVEQFTILETMLPTHFLAFRNKLEPASGFQSEQFRELEFLCGLKDEKMLRYHRPTREAYARLRRRLEEPSLHDALFAALRAIGKLPAASGMNDREQFEIRARAILSLYKDEHHYRDWIDVCERLTEFDELVVSWRLRHIQMVERIIGIRMGTGGSTGASYLKLTLDKKFFPELWEARTLLTE
ncbi:MAG: tryptophan 2,3-dioxygenase family protein, partial [Candidatus Sulfotelmatobacter sp.]